MASEKALKAKQLVYSSPEGGGGVLIYFSVRGRAAEQGITFRIPNPGQGIIIFVEIGSGRQKSAP